MKNDFEIVMDFSKELIKKFNGLIRAVALFGSYAKGKSTEKSDIDVVVIVDDVYNKWDPLVREWYREECAKILKSDKKYEKIHLNTITLSVFWDMLRVGDPLAINIIRYSIPVIDSLGLLGTMKALLKLGKIKPSVEAINNLLSRIPLHFNMHKYYKFKALEAIYWVFVDSSQIYLMKHGKNPGSPEDIPRLLKETGLNKNLIEWYKQIYDLIKRISRNEIKDVSWETIEKWYERAIKFHERVLKE